MQDPYISQSSDRVGGLEDKCTVFEMNSKISRFNSLQNAYNGRNHEEGRELAFSSSIKEKWRVSSLYFTQEKSRSRGSQIEFVSHCPGDIPFCLCLFSLLLMFLLWIWMCLGRVFRPPLGKVPLLLVEMHWSSSLRDITCVGPETWEGLISLMAFSKVFQVFSSETHLDHEGKWVHRKYITTVTYWG